jgi:hypothetical protein
MPKKNPTLKHPTQHQENKLAHFFTKKTAYMTLTITKKSKYVMIAHDL